MTSSTYPQKIPCVYMRGGTSKGPFFKADDLPRDEQQRDAVLLDIMGSPHPLQVNGIGGSQPQTSKVAIISQSDRCDADIDYLFAQVMIDEARVDTNPNCGNMLSAVGPFAIEEGLHPAQIGSTTVRIYNINTGTIIHSIVQTPNAEVTYRGEQQLDGVSGCGAPIFLHFLNAAGAKTGRLLPTGKSMEEINNIPVSLIDYSVPMMLVEAKSLGLQGHETADELEEYSEILSTVESMRIEAGLRMGLGCVKDKVIPKVAIVTKGRKGGDFSSRYLTPHSCHKSHAITGAMCLTAACFIEGSIMQNVTGHTYYKDREVVLEHPSGKINLNVILTGETIPDKKIDSIAVVRTARRLFEGHVLTT